MRGLTTEQKILLHLYRHPRGNYEDRDVPFALTQEGIAEAIGTTRNYVAVVLRRHRGGAILCETRYVEGHKKRKVYFLTEYGRGIVEKLIKDLLETRINLITPSGEVLDVPLRDIGKYINDKDAVVKALLIMKDGILELPPQESQASPFVGRKEEIHRFESVLKDIVEGKGVCITVYGEAGMGKTALLNKFADIAAHHGFLVLKGKGYKNLADPYYPILNMFRSSVNFPNRSKIVRLFQRMHSFRGGDLSHGVFERRAIWYDISVEIEKIARKKPVIMLVDDFHMLNDTAVEFIATIFKRLRNRAFGLVLSYDGRESKIKNFMKLIEGEITREEIILGAFSEVEISEFASKVAGKKLSKDLLSEIENMTSGNPLFVAEMLRDFAVSDRKKFDSSPSMEELIEHKLDTISPQEREIIRLCSVIGERIPIRLISKLTGLNYREINLIVMDLVRAGFLENVSTDIYSFTHPIIRTLIYRNVPDRRDIHLKIADMIKEEHPCILDVGYHYEMAHMPEKAVEFYIKIAEKLKKTYAFEDAITYLERALKLSRKHRMKNNYFVARELASLYTLRGFHRKALSIYEDLLKEFGNNSSYLYLAQVYRQLGDFKNALVYIEKGLKQEENGMVRVKMLSERFWLLLKLGRVEESWKTLEQIKELVYDDVSRAVYLEDMATYHHYLGNAKKAARYLSEEIGIKEKMGEDTARLHTNYGILLAQMGKLDEALIEFEKGLKLDKEKGDILGIAQSCSNLGIIYKKMKKYTLAAKYLKKAAMIYEKIGAYDSLAIAHLNLGNIFVELGNYDSALYYLNKSLKGFERVNDQWGLCHAYYSMGDFFFNKGKYDDSFCWLNRALILAKKIKNNQCLCDSYMLLSLLYIALKEYELARAVGKKARTCIDVDEIYHRKIGVIDGIVDILEGKFERGKDILEKSLENYSGDVLFSIASCILEYIKKAGNVSIERMREIFELENCKKIK